MFVNRISGSDYTHTSQNKISFQSKFVPNEALKDAIYIAGVDTKYGNSWERADGRSFAKIIDYLLNDGKDDLIKVTRSAKGSTLIINGKRVNFYSELPPSHGFVDGRRVIKNVVNYFTKNEVTDFIELSKDEFKLVKPEVDKLNAELNADDVTKNPHILFNLQENMNNINTTLAQHTAELLDKLEAKIFGK